TGQLVQNGDLDFYEFSLDVPRYLAFTFTAPESAGSFQINLYKEQAAEENEIDSFIAIGSQTTTVHVGLSVGRYYVKVSAAGAADTGHYYTLAFAPSDQTNLEMESNNTLKFANVIEKNKPKKGRIYSGKDYDIYSFNLSEAADVDIRLKPSSSNSEYNICVVNETFIDDTETPCESRAARNGQEMTFTYYPETAGNYYIRIWGISGKIDPSKTYELNISSDSAIAVMRQKVGLAVSGAQKEMTIGGVQSLKALMAWSDATTEEKTPKWTSLDVSVASVDAAGIVKAGTKEGNTSIVASFEGFTARFDITVGIPADVKKQHYGNLILVGGGGYAVTNTLRDTTLYLSDLVYRRFKERLFTDEDIYYFHPWAAHDLNGDGYPENIVRDTTPTVEKLGKAIKEWAVQQNTDGPLYLYLIDHGGMDYFTLFEDEKQVKENLTSSKLNEFIDAFQASTTRKVIVIIEACRSGSFIDNLVSPGQNRIVITSTNDQYLLLSRLGTDSFTQFFMDKLWEGNSLNTAFNNARQKLSTMGAPYSQQVPLLKDGSSLASTKLGGNFGVAGAMPEFLEKSADTNIDASNPSNMTQELFGRFDSTVLGDIEKVWGVVVPPSYETSGTGTEVQTIKFDSVDLADSEHTGRYVGSYDQFMQNGEYRIIFYARSTNGNIIMSAPTIFTVTGGTATAMSLTVTTKSGTGTGKVTSLPSGINCGSDCTEAYGTQTSVTLTATADSGSKFTGWSGSGCRGTGVCTVSVNASLQVSAEFLYDNRGDLNGDGVTNLADAILAFKVLSRATLPADAIRSDYATS
ncbi:MAG: C13 family peptidase, partial [Candidatus Omnitrophota bacterium]